MKILHTNDREVIHADEVHFIRGSGGAVYARLIVDDLVFREELVDQIAIIVDDQTYDNQRSGL